MKLKALQTETPLCEEAAKIYNFIFWPLPSMFILVKFILCISQIKIHRVFLLYCSFVLFKFHNTQVYFTEMYLAALKMDFPLWPLLPYLWGQ